MTIDEFIAKYDPCEEGTKYLLSQKSLKEAWENCEDIYLLTWGLSKTKLDTNLRKQLAQFSIDCIEHPDVWKHLTDGNKRAVIVVKKYLAGEATKEELAKARKDAYAAYDAAYAAAYVAAAAAAADVYAAARAAAAYAAAVDAADATRAVAAAYVAADATRAVAAAYVADKPAAYKQWQLKKFKELIKPDFDNL